MIKKIDINKFGCFKNFEWNSSAQDNNNNVVELKKLNIIYGWNYSGKTTFSKIFQTLETGTLPNNYNELEFTIQTYDSEITQEEIADNSIDVRVYNTEFVKSNLSFLYDHDGGDLKPFALIGSDNNDAHTKIEELNKELGDVDKQLGLRYQDHQKLETQAAIAHNHSGRKADLKTKKVKFASKNIKVNSLLHQQTYNITKIDKDIETIKDFKIPPLTDENEGIFKSLLKTESLPDINLELPKVIDLKELFVKANDLLEKEIEPTEPIQKLLNDAVLQAWVKDGMGVHNREDKECNFCGNQLPIDLWSKLDGHFNQQTIILENNINDIILKLKKEIERVSQSYKLEKNLFYIENYDKVSDVEKKYNSIINEYKKYLDQFVLNLNNKESDIYSKIEKIELSDFYNKENNCINEIQSLIGQNNQRTQTLDKDQNVVREYLRLGLVAKFLNDINYQQELIKIEKLGTKLTKAQEARTLSKEAVEQAENQISILQSQLKEETVAAEKINEYLGHYFGHKKMKLIAKEDEETKSYIFQIYRDGEPAYNMSEGECNLISFCYFVAKLEELGDNRVNTIIYIDDPISSLDNNHVYFIFSLIESEIAKKSESGEFNYKQLILSTHNLDFLKYIKRLTKPMIANESMNANVPDVSHFIIEENGDRSIIKLMPKHLRKYATEFNYLFEQIYNCKDVNNSEEKPSSFYSFGNNMRKFLEVYLYYKYPNSNSHSHKIKQFFGDDNIAVTLMQRVTNEYSHLENGFDRSMHPIDFSEISKITNFVLKKISEKDIEQYKALLKSIGQQLDENCDNILPYPPS